MYNQKLFDEDKNYINYSLAQDIENPYKLNIICIEPHQFDRMMR